MFFLLYRPEALPQANNIKTYLSGKYGYEEGEFNLKDDVVEPGSMEQSIRKQIKESSSVILLVTKSLFLPERKTSDYYLEILKIALEENKIIIPVIYPESNIKNLKDKRVHKELTRTIKSEEIEKIQGLTLVTYDATNEEKTFETLNKLIGKTSRGEQKAIISAVSSVIISLALTFVFCLTIGGLMGFFLNSDINDTVIIKEQSRQIGNIYYFLNSDSTLAYDATTKTILPSQQYVDLQGAIQLPNYTNKSQFATKKSELPWYLTIWVSPAGEKACKILMANSKPFTRAIKSGNPKSKVILAVGAVLTVVVCYLGVNPGIDIGQYLKRKYLISHLSGRLSTDPDAWQPVINEFEYYQKIDSIRSVKHERTIYTILDSIKSRGQSQKTLMAP